MGAIQKIQRDIEWSFLRSPIGTRLEVSMLINIVFQNLYSGKRLVNLMVTTPEIKKITAR